MRQFETCEFTFQGPAPVAGWTQVDVRATFTSGDARVDVRGFYAGDGAYKVRFLPRTVGEWRYEVSGVVSGSGRFTVEPHEEGQHGLVVADGLHFRFEDDAKYLPFGTTVYALAHQDDSLTEQTFTSLAASPFNKVRMCLFPKHYNYNHNEPPFYAFEKTPDGSWDVSRPCLAFWDRFERIIGRLAELRIQIDLILFHPYDRWGFATLPQADNLIYLDYLMRRFAALPNLWWSLANEYDLVASKTLDDWYGIEEFIAANDPYRHLLSNHNCFTPWDFTRPAVTHVSYQTKRLTRIPHWSKQYGKPVVVDECCYEGSLPEGWGNISGREMTARVWRVVASGGYCTHGETFYAGEEGIVWWARGGRLVGESPARIAFLKDLVYGLPGPLDSVTTRGEGLVKLVGMARTLGIRKTIEEYGLHDYMDGMLLGLLNLDTGEMAAFFDGEPEFKSRCGDEAILEYLDLQCTAIYELNLPAGSTYRVEIVDSWDMTRTVALEHASGKVRIDLPGKEGIAVLATRES
jgi:hypothetical protein